MPTISKRISNITGEVSYQVKVRVKGYPPETTTFAKKTDAIRWGQRIESDMKDAKHFSNAKAKKHTVSELIDKYLSAIKGSNPRRHDDVKPLLDWWKDEIGTSLLSHIQSEQVAEGQQKLLDRFRPGMLPDGKRAKISPATVNRYRVALHTAFKYGIKPLKWISTNPVDDVDKLEEPHGRTRYLSKDEVKKLLDACKASKNSHLFAVVMIGLATGARRGEIENVRWADVNADCTAITLLKTKNGLVRTIHLTGKASEIVKQMREAKKPDDVFLFQSPYDATCPLNFQSSWLNALKTAKVKDFRFHDLRHTHASYLAMGGASTLQIAESLGHIRQPYTAF